MKVNEVRAVNGPFEGLKGVEVLIVCKLDRWQNQSRVVCQCNDYNVIAAHTQRPEKTCGERDVSLRDSISHLWLGPSSVLKRFFFAFRG